MIVSLNGKDTDKYLKAYKRLIKKIENYNKSAEKLGFSKISFDTKCQLPTHFNILSTNMRPSNIFKLIWWAIQYDYMKFKWNRIYEAAKKMHKFKIKKKK